MSKKVKSPSFFILRSKSFWTWQGRFWVCIKVNYCWDSWELTAPRRNPLQEILLSNFLLISRQLPISSDWNVRSYRDSTYVSRRDNSEEPFILWSPCDQLWLWLQIHRYFAVQQLPLTKPTSFTISQVLRIFCYYFSNVLRILIITK